MGFVRADLGRLRDGLRGAWRTGGGLRGAPMAVCLAALVLTASFVQRTDAGAELIERTGVVRASLPPGTALLRTPLSIVVPAPDLPAWGAVAQVLVVFGLAELTLGRLRTLAVALAVTYAGTLYTRLGVWLGPGAFAGLDAGEAQVRDTGPSAAVVALAVVLAWRWRSWLLLGAVVAAMAGEYVVKPNLAGRQHLVAVAVALALAALMGRAAREREGRKGREGREERDGPAGRGGRRRQRGGRGPRGSGRS